MIKLKYKISITKFNKNNCNNTDATDLYSIDVDLWKVFTIYARSKVKQNNR